MKKILKRIVLIILSLVLVFAFVACGGGDDDGDGPGRTKVKTIKFLHIWQEHSAVFTKIANDFMAENEDIIVDISISDYSNIATVLNSQIISQSLPDVFFYWTNQIQGYIAAGALADLSPYTEGWIDTYIDDGAPSWGLAKRGTAYYSVPLRQSGNVIVYNKTLFDEKDLEVPTTYQEFETLLQTVRGFSNLSSYSPVAVSGANGGYLIDFWYMLNNFHALLQESYKDPNFASGLIDDSDQVSLKYSAKTLDKIADLYSKGYFGQAEGKSDETAVRNFKEGNAAMVYMNYNNINLLGDVEFEYGYFSVPGPSGMDYNYLRSDYDGFCVAKTSKNKDAAVRFLKYLTSKDVMQYFANATSSIVPVEGVEYEDPINQQLANVLNSSGTALLNQSEITYSTGGIQNDVVEAVYDIIYGKSSYTTLKVAEKISDWYADCIDEAGLERYAPAKAIDETKDYSWLEIRK